ERKEIAAKVKDADSDAEAQVWASYRYLIVADSKADSGLAVIDLGAGHASSGETLAGRILATLRQRALLNDAPGASYLERKWPRHFAASGAWPLLNLRQAFLDGTLD